MIASSARNAEAGPALGRAREALRAALPRLPQRPQAGGALGPRRGRSKRGRLLSRTRGSGQGEARDPVRRPFSACLSLFEGELRGSDEAFDKAARGRDIAFRAMSRAAGHAVPQAAMRRMKPRFLERALRVPLEALARHPGFESGCQRSIELVEGSLPRRSRDRCWRSPSRGRWPRARASFPPGARRSCGNAS